MTRIRLAHSLNALEDGDLSHAIDLSGYATGQAFARVLKDRDWSCWAIMMPSTPELTISTAGPY